MDKIEKFVKLEVPPLPTFQEMPVGWWLLITTFLLFISKSTMAQSSVSLMGTNTNAHSCVDTSNGTITIQFDQALNCPEVDPANVLAGRSALGFHSGANEWAQTVPWNDPNALTAMNNGQSLFTVTFNVMDYYGIQLDDLVNIKCVMNDGITNPTNPWDTTGRDERDGGFGGSEPCSDLEFIKAEAPSCPDTAAWCNTVTNVLSDGAGSLRAAINCMKDTVFFHSVLARQTIPLDTPSIVINKPIVLVANPLDSIQIGNADSTNTSPLLIMQDSVIITGLDFNGCSDSTLIFQVDTGGALEICDSDLDKVTIVKS